MAETKKIKKFILGLTQNNDQFMARIWFEGMEDTDNPYMNFQPEYLLTKKTGDEIEVTVNKNFVNIILSDKSKQMLDSQIMKNVKNNIIELLQHIKNEERIVISQEEADEMVDVFTNDYMNFANRIYGNIISHKSDLGKALKENADQPKTKQTIDVTFLTSYLTNVFNTMFSKFYKIAG